MLKISEHTFCGATYGTSGVSYAPWHGMQARLTVDGQLPSPINDPTLKYSGVMDGSLPEHSTAFTQWGNYHLLLLASAVKRHGTGDWSRILQELKSCALKNGIPYAFSAEACEQKFDAWREQRTSSSSDCRDHEICETMLAELTRQRVAHLKRELEVYDENIGSLQRKIRKLESERAEGLAHNRPSAKAAVETTADFDTVSVQYELVCSTRHEVAACELSYSLQPVPMEDILFESRQTMEVGGDAVGVKPRSHEGLGAKNALSAGRSCKQEHKVAEFSVEGGSSAGLYCEHHFFEEAGRVQDRVRGNPCGQCLHAKDITLDLARKSGVSCDDADQSIFDRGNSAAGVEENVQTFASDDISSISSSDEVPSSGVQHITPPSVSKLTAGSPLMTMDSILVHVLDEHKDMGMCYELVVKAGVQGFNGHEACAQKIGQPCGIDESASLPVLSKEIQLPDPNICCHNDSVTCVKAMFSTDARNGCEGEQLTSIISPSGPVSNPFCKEVPGFAVKDGTCIRDGDNQDEQAVTLSNALLAPSLKVPFETEVLSGTSACSTLEEIMLSRCSTQALDVDYLQGTEGGVENCLRRSNMLVQMEFFEDSTSQASQLTANVQPTSQLKLGRHVPGDGVSAIQRPQTNLQLLTQTGEVAVICGDEVGKRLLNEGVDKLMKSGCEILSEVEANQDGESKCPNDDTHENKACRNSPSVPEPTGIGTSHEGSGAAVDRVKDVDDPDELQDSRNSGYTQIEKSEVGSPFEGADDTSPISRRNKREPKVAGKLLPLLDCLRAICMHKFAPLFKQRQEGQEKGRYHHLIRRHMDLSMIRARLEEGVYSGSLEFFRDLLLIFNNALVYYERDAPEHVAAKVLRDAAVQEMRKIIEREALLKQDGPSTRNREPKRVADPLKLMTPSAGDGKRRGSLRLSSMDNRSTDSTLDFEDVSKRDNFSTLGHSNNSRSDEAGNYEEEAEERSKEVKMGGRNIRLKVKDHAELERKKLGKAFGRARPKNVKEEQPAVKASVRSKAKEDVNMGIEVKRSQTTSSKSALKSDDGLDQNQKSVSELKTSKTESRLQATSHVVVLGKGRPARTSKRPASVMQATKETKRPPHMQLKKRR